MKKIKYIFLIFISMFIFLPFVTAEEKDVDFYLFYGRECPHCEELLGWLDIYMNENPNIKLHKYEVWHSEENIKKFELVQKALKTDSSSVPFLAIGEDYIVGFSSTYTPQNVDSLLKKYENGNYKDVTGIALGVKKDVKEVKTKIKNENKSFDVPILGKINAKDTSIPLLGAVLGFVDGFNPCAMWVLIFLISMLIGMKDKKKMITLGVIFLVTSALVYAAFMVSWLSFALFVGKVKIIQFLIGVFAVIFGSYNVIRFIKTLETDVGCEVVNEKRRTKIINKIKNIVKEQKFFIAILGVVVLAFSVNLIELMCSLGLPLIYTQVLSLNDLSAFSYFIYIVIYIFFYLIDDLVIFLIAIKTLQIKAISNKYVKYSHLIGGLIMLLLGILMLTKPEWLMFNF